LTANTGAFGATVFGRQKNTGIIFERKRDYLLTLGGGGG
jgi:hypothetical protein